MFDQLKAVLQNIISLDELEWEFIKRSFLIKEVPARYSLTKAGEVERQLYFVNKGIVRLFSAHLNGKEITTYFFTENNFASCYESFLTSTPNYQNLETLEACTLLFIDKERLDRLYQKIPKMNIVARVLTEQRFANAQHIFSSHLLLNPEERYREFEQIHADLLGRVPQHIIASFLGVTPVSLSRIRQRIYKKHVLSGMDYANS